MSDVDAAVTAAADAIRSATALVVSAGAGMGVDSGLPDFRGPEGFWNAYPPYRHLGLGFMDLANPRWFDTDPELAWGFYGHRLELYRSTPPHAGFAILRRWAERVPGGAFVFTSNVDGHFQKAGFAEARVVECHGALSFLQCLSDCGQPIFSSAGVSVGVDPASFRARPPLPACPSCGGLARPNVLMFGDWGWDGTRTEEQEGRLDAWLHAVLRGSSHDAARLVVVECGAGGAVPTVRSFGERLAASGARLVRVNLREPEVPRGQVGVALGARDALTRIDARLA